ncbi:SPASM domain-containing protein [Thermus antranikianii]|uniref:SPASM domain-containing protein n=1 Tax=Thermus antranikianii TaxID=88190 RepID=A0ABY7RP36_9DEIN|nr:SPASM domain-containing protein [Thermus antranikianii]WCM38666.1 SPASM domain-containing protein [Thermus antranikianii]
MKPDLHRFPLLVAWEMTRACLLACQHCRASAVPDPLPGELTLVPVGRGALLEQLSPEEYEEVMHLLYDLSRRYPFKVRTTEGPMFRRVALERRKKEGGEDGALVGEGRGVHLSDGFGFVFVSSTGEVYPSGFLPLSAGNVREKPLLEIYRNSPLFLELRNKALLKGKCGVCEYRELCGGSRARAWAETGDHLAADPRCAYIPKGLGQMPLA